MTLTPELKEVKEMLHKITEDVTKISEAQRQMKEEVVVVREELRRFRELWAREKAEIEERLQRLEEAKAKRELQRRLERFDRMDEALELRERRAEAFERVARKEREHASTVSIQYKKLRSNEKNMVLKDGQRLIKQLFGPGKTDL